MCVGVQNDGVFLQCLRKAVEWSWRVHTHTHMHHMLNSFCLHMYLSVTLSWNTHSHLSQCTKHLLFIHIKLVFFFYFGSPVVASFASSHNPRRSQANQNHWNCQLFCQGNVFRPECECEAQEYISLAQKANKRIVPAHGSLNSWTGKKQHWTKYSRYEATTHVDEKE